MKLLNYLFYLSCLSIVLSCGEDTSEDTAPVFDSPGFVTTWQTTVANDIIIIPTDPNLTYDYRIEWGDGETDTNVTGDASHNYAEAGNYTVAITGDFPAIYFGSDVAGVEASRTKIKSVEQWGNISWKSMFYAFLGCENLAVKAKDSPDLSETTSLRGIFRGATSFNQDISQWDVKNITEMTDLFFEASSFNQDISAWDVSNVTNMNSMFLRASNFNQDIGNWDVSNVVTMNSMFWLASAFNQDISQWDVSNLTDFFGLFFSATSFNQDISSWDVGNALDMANMFNQASSFNQDISGWKVGKVTEMFLMFYSATSFNQNISRWDVSNVTNCTSFSDLSVLAEVNEPNFTNCNPE